MEVLPPLGDGTRLPGFARRTMLLTLLFDSLNLGNKIYIQQPFQLIIHMVNLVYNYQVLANLKSKIIYNQQVYRDASL